MRKSKKLILALFILASVGRIFTNTHAQNGGSAQNVLASLAASMQPGTFALLNQEGDASGYGGKLLLTGGSSSIMGFASKAAYDPVSDRIYFSGGEHGGRTKTIHYEIATNRWIDDGDVPQAFHGGHAYDSNVIIPGARELYVSSTLIPNLRRLNLDNNTWSDVPQVTGFYQTEPSVEYFPERDELLWLQGGWFGGLAKYSHTANSWTTVTKSLSALQLRGAIARYVPAQHAVLLMGGVNTDPVYGNPPGPAVPSHAVYKYDRNGAISRLRDFPSSIWMYPNQAVAVVDPVSSELVVINAVLKGNVEAYSGNIEFWRYNLGTDTWTQMDANAVPPTKNWWLAPGRPFAVLTVPLSKYGVTMFMTASYELPESRSTIYLYKHAGSKPVARDIADPPVSAPEGSAPLVPSPAAPAPRVVAAVSTPTPGPTPNNGPAVSRSGAVSFAEKCGQSGVLGCYGFDSGVNVRNMPGVRDLYPLKYGGWGGVGPCASAGLGAENIYTRNRNAPNELNALAKDQNGACVYPTIDNAVFATGGGALRVEVPSDADSGNGGYFDTTFQGLDKPSVRVGPDNGGELWHQFQYRTHNLATNKLNGAFSGLAKVIIFGNQPPGLDWLGSDVTMASVFGYDMDHEGIWESYTRMADGNLTTHERMIGGNLYMQTGTQCAYAGPGPYKTPPCIKDVDDSWQEITRYFKLRPVAADFSVSGTALSKRNAFRPNMVGRYIYIVGDGYYRIDAFVDANSVTLSTAPVAGRDKTVYISNSANSIIQQWVNGALITDISDAQFAWDLVNPGWGEFRLAPHMTNKNPGIAHIPGTVWYDDFIVSTQPIVMVTHSPSPPSRVRR